MAVTDSIRSCANCGHEIIGRNRGAIYCSDRCKWRVKDRNRPQRVRQRSKVQILVACHGCGVTAPRLKQREDAGRYCSRECYQRAKQVVTAEVDALGRIRKSWGWRPSAEVTAEAEALKRIARRTIRQFRTQRGCTKCGAPVIGVLNWRRTCRACKDAETRRQRRIAKAARKARLKGTRRESIDPIAVFERDGWRCYLCGNETPRFLRGTLELNAPELEHKVALANGGTHTWDNVACACRACNAEKGAKRAA